MTGACVEWGIAQRTAQGQCESGDFHVIKPTADGVLLGVLDGLGHGRDAAEASRLAAQTIEANATEPLRSIFRKCHDRLTGTRGVVMSAARINAAEKTVIWTGVGNVEAKLFRASSNISPDMEYLLLRSGVVGVNLPLLYVATMPILPGDLIIFATDGIRPTFFQEVVRTDPVQKIADTILVRRIEDNDDALVLVARYNGQKP